MGDQAAARRADEHGFSDAGIRHDGEHIRGFDGDRVMVGIDVMCRETSAPVVEGKERDAALRPSRGVEASGSKSLRRAGQSGQADDGQDGRRRRPDIAIVET